MSPKTKPNPDLLERQRQFEVVSKVAIQTGVFGFGGNGRRHNHVALNMLGQEKFGLTHREARKCVAQAQILLANCSNSVSSETLLIAERKRQANLGLRVLKNAA